MPTFHLSPVSASRPSGRSRHGVSVALRKIVTTTILFCIGLVLTLLFGERAIAKPVISEVGWMGSDLSTSDEWVEITPDDPDDDLTPIAGWTLTSVNSAGTETTIFTFPANASVAAGQFLIVSRFAAAQSRLMSEPAFVASSLTLPNSKLLLRLRDEHGGVIDQADDGVGDPMAGSNTAPKASMERIDLTKPGTDSANWRTATLSQGFDDGAVISGTPGFSPPDHPLVSSAPSSSSSAGASSSAFNSSSSSSSAASSSSLPSSPFSPFSSSSCPAFDPYIALQSGATTGEDKVTLNVQIAARNAALGSVTCSVDFGDGTAVSSSCNPPSHTYDRPGSYTIRAEIRHSCAGVLLRTMAVEVIAKTTSSPSSGSEVMSDDSVFDGAVHEPFPQQQSGQSPFLLTAVLPNPSGKDAGNEWVEITNMANHSADLAGWTLRLPHAKKSTYVFGNIGFSALETRRFSANELGMTLGNESGEFSLLTPGQVAVSALAWKDAKDGVVIRLQRTFSGKIAARVTHVIDGDTFDVEIGNLVTAGIGRTERVRMIGIDAPELHAKDAGQRMLAKRAQDVLRQLLEGTTVELTPGTDARDTYGRLLAYVSILSGDSVQELLLRDGFVSVYLRYAFPQEAEYLQYQREAQDGNRGMWGIVGADQPLLLSPAISGKTPVQATTGAYGNTPLQDDSPNAVTITHLSSSASSSSKSAKAKKSSSSPKKKKATVKKKSSSSVKKSASSAALAADLLALRDLIEDPEDFSEEEEEESGPDFADEDAVMTPLYPQAELPDPPAGNFSMIWLGAGIAGMASVSGFLGWVLGRKRR